MNVNLNRVISRISGISVITRPQFILWQSLTYTEMLQNEEISVTDFLILILKKDLPKANGNGTYHILPIDIFCSQQYLE